MIEEPNMQDLIMKAFEGNSNAQLELGNCYLNGWNIEENYENAFMWYEKAAMQDNCEAQHNLALCYGNGLGTSYDADQSFYWYSKAAEKGMPEALYKVGLFYLEGTSVEKDLDLAFKYISEAAKYDIPLAVHDLGACYANGWGVSQNLEFAQKYFIKAARLDKEDGKCKFALGICYLSGDCFEQDHNKAFYWIEQAALMDYPDAEVMLGDLYYNGIGCKENKEMAIHCWEIAAKSEISDAIYKLSCCYESGECDYPVNIQLAKELYVKAANLGSLDAQVRCALEYLQKDEPSNQEYQIAYEWLVKANDLNNPFAKMLLAEFYQNGIIVSESMFQTLKLYEEALSLGCDEAADSIVICYKYGGNDMKPNASKARKLAKDFGLDYDEL